MKIYVRYIFIFNLEILCFKIIFGMLLIKDVLRVGSIVAICLFSRLKKKKGSFFQSITSLQKNSAKVSSRRDALEEKSAGARNDYLLSLSAANAHQVFVVFFIYL